MHSFTTLLSLFLLTTTTAHMLPPQPPHPNLLPRSSLPLQQNTCAFTLLHKQLSPSKTNYIFLPTITSHAAASTDNHIFNIAASKPAQAHNSYSRVSATQKFSVRGLPGGETLTVGGRDGEDELVFETEGGRWVAGGGVSGEMGCEVAEWVESGVNRERKLECVFPCQKMDGEEVTLEGERVELR